ncbi:hypothetical protein BJ165DRAFT_1332172, partial [Panaeolus papilionaceus]
NFPTETLIKYLTVPGLRSLAAAHGIKTSSRIAKSTCLSKLNTHTCSECPDYLYTFCAFDLVRPSAKGSCQGLKDTFSWYTYDPAVVENYPPKPASLKIIADIMSAYSNDLNPKVIEETGCAVCGQLTPLHTMIPLADIQHQLDVLIEPGATRAERFDIMTPCTPCDGPVLAPLVSLANWLWIGEVPGVLQNLTLAEQVLISRVRHNYCVVRIANGHSKMIANAIAFEHASWKICNILPIAQSELDDVLSVVFTGKVRPTKDDLKRTPVLVRRKRVQDALEWLRLNHKDYYDLTIDYDILGTYPSQDVPLGFLYKCNLDNEGNIPDAAKSVFDPIDE